MAGTEVSSVIRDILDAFHNGLSVFKTKGRKHRRRHSEPINANEEKRVRDSFSQRPQEIKQVYDKSVAKHGRRFEVGDSTSQTSLAQILLVLNTGLIKLLNHALSSDKSRSQSRNSILNLSETAALDTLSALSELNLRIASASRIDLRLPPSGPPTEHDEKRKPRPRAQSCSKQSKRPPPSPLIHYGGWVRSKTDPSVVSVVVSPRARKTDQKRTSASRSSSVSPTKNASTPSEVKVKERRSPPPRYSQLADKTAPQLRPKPEHLQAKVSIPPNDYGIGTGKQVGRHPSMYIVPADFFDIFPHPSVERYEPQAVDSMQAAPGRPPQVPHHSRPQQLYQQPQPQHIAPRFEGRVRPPSMMTFMTASTKIGEIPEHRLPDRVLTEEQQEEIPMPYVVPDMLDPPRKRGGRGLKFWKKDRQEKCVAGAVGA
ncbi:hypothetical protein PMZ80_007053 [Knufia obscura]|uniref:Uncharacterized protein n=2 Tax=Knufia TaxID=430999 RepID=A0AAN8IMD2_9EURO|nr:hypothetical protein PMZ80_007053 [Knufia obscura]KAK5953062.1 hypothetical protein OHC33_005630 [Knufia fluminis]